MTYPFSSHNYEFRYWLGAGGNYPDRDVIMTVVPPPFTADALASGAIDGFCVNAPWNMLAVARGVGRVVAVKADIWPSSPEKVLGVRPDWADQNAETLARLIVALDRAAAWCDVPENRGELAAMLTAYVDAPLDLVRDLLFDRLLVDPDGRFRTIPNYLTFHGQATGFPWISEALWSYSQMVRWGQSAYSPESEAAAASACRPDLYRRALAGLRPAHPEPGREAGRKPRADFGADEPRSAGVRGKSLHRRPDIQSARHCGLCRLLRSPQWFWRAGRLDDA